MDTRTRLVGAAAVGLLLTFTSLAATLAVGASSITNATAPATGEGSKPQVAIVQGVQVTIDELKSGLIEAAGGVILQEFALDKMLAERLKSSGLTITLAMIDSERTELMREVGIAADQKTGDEALRTINRVRAARGLGPKRFEALLARNATLRAIVSPGITIGDPDIAAGFAVAHGPKAAIRLATFSSVGDAKIFRDQVVKSAGDGRAEDSGPVGPRALAFSQAAMTKSTDASATVGGKIEPLSTADERYPRAIRTAVDSLSPGMLSDVLALDRGFAIVLIEEKRPADTVTLDAVRLDIERQLRSRQQRLAMDKLARALLAEAQVMVTDSSLAWSWETVK